MAVRGGNVLVGAGERVLRALVALPRQLVFVVRAATRSPDEVSHPSPTQEPQPGRGTPLGRALVGLPIALVATLAAAVLLFALARAIWYPFWAAGASEDALARSWGGPSPVGATLVHWLVAAATVAVMYGIVLVMGRLAGEPR